jgi:EAL and modified HD-GYP domain-containing signal transduction protein
VAGVGSKAGVPMDAFVSRQPILDADQCVSAYELRFRSGLDDVLRTLQSDHTERDFLREMQSLTPGKMALVRVTPESLLQRRVCSLPKESFIVASSARHAEDRDILEAYRSLKDQGYLLAFFDWDLSRSDPLLELANAVIVDFQKINGKERESIPKSIPDDVMFLLGERVQTHDTFRQAVKAGYTHCMGSFFTRPSLQKSRDISEVELHHLRLLCELNSRLMSVRQMASLLESDRCLSSKLLQSLNSRRVGLLPPTSIREVLEHMDMKELRQCASFIILTALGERKPESLATMAAARGVFCADLASTVGLDEREGDASLVGILSMLDAFLDRPLSDVLPSLPVRDEIKGVLSGHRSELRRILDCAIAVQEGDWDALLNLIGGLGIDEADLSWINRQVIQAEGRLPGEG